MQNNRYLYKLLTAALILFFAACSGSADTATILPEAAPTKSTAAIPTEHITTEPTRPPSKTPVPAKPKHTPAPTAEPTQTVTPIPTEDSFAISIENFTNLTLLDYLGGASAGKISQITWSVDGKWLFVSGELHILLYDAQTLELHAKLDKPDYYAFIHDGAQYAALTGSHLAIHNTQDSTLEKSISLENYSGSNPVISPDGNLLAALTMTNQVGWWDLNSGVRVQEVPIDVELQVEQITGAMFSMDSSKLFAATFAGGVYKITLETGAVERVYRAAYVPDPNATSNTRDDCAIHRANGHYLVVLCGHYTPTADFSTIESSSYTIKWVDVNTEAHQTTTFGVKNSLSESSLSPDGQALYIQGSDAFRLLRRTPEEILIEKVPSCLNHTSDPFFTGPSGMGQAAVINGYETGEFFLCSFTSGEKSAWLDLDPPTSTAAAVFQGEHLVAIGNCAGAIEIWNPQHKVVVHEISGHNTCISDLVFSPDGRFLASGDEDGMVAFWDLAADDGKPILSYSHPGKVIDLALNSDGSNMGSVSETELQLWDTVSGENLTNHKHSSGGHIGFGNGSWVAHTEGSSVYWESFTGLHNKAFIEAGNLIFDLGAQLLISNYQEGGTINFFNIRGGSKLPSINIGSRDILSAALSPDGCLLMGLPSRGEVMFWRTNPLEFVGEVETNFRNPNRILDTAVSPDGHLVIFASMDGTVQVWGVPGVLSAPAGSIIPRDICSTITLPTATPTGVPTQTPTATPISPTPTPVVFTRALFLTSPNIQGPDVLALQKKLLDLGYNEVGVPDGIFGGMTDQAIRRYQADNNLTVDGVVGPVTWGMLFGGD